MNDNKLPNVIIKMISTMKRMIFSNDSVIAKAKFVAVALVTETLNIKYMPLINSVAVSFTEVIGT